MNRNAVRFIEAEIQAGRARLCDCNGPHSPHDTYRVIDPAVGEVCRKCGATDQDLEDNAPCR